MLDHIIGMRAIAYIDGFNLYHAIDEIGKPNPRRPKKTARRRPHLKWLDLWTLCQSITRPGETLEEVNYFSAYATWRADAHRRHIEYVKALQHVGVNCIMGHFKTKSRKCMTCATEWTGHEEKETDSHMAARIVFDACKNRYDRMILITADSDIKPAIDLVSSHFPEKQLFIAAPPGRKAHARGISPNIEITAGRLEKNLLPERALGFDGRCLFQRPASYNPPV